jgi:putative molybdopterin biosynthesis protein
VPDHPGAGHRLGPQAAYAQWLEECANTGWRAVPVAERVPVADGLGRVTAAPVRARWAAPRSACAAMDGIALNADSVPGPLAPAEPWRLAVDRFTWVDTGDPVPAGLDTVVERERVRTAADGSTWITGPAPRGLHVRARGEDFEAAQLLLPAGHRLRPADLAAAAASGHTRLRVARRPVAAVIPTGNEVRPVGSALRPGEVTDSNSLLIASRAGETGAQARVSRVQPDNPDTIAAEVRRAARGAGLVLVIAGSSGGRRDHTAAVLGEAGGLAVRGIAVRPGHPALLGYVRPDRDAAAVPAIGVPGYPLAAAVVFELFGVPLLCALQGLQPPERAWRRVRLGRDWTSSPDVEDWVPVSLAPVMPVRPAARWWRCRAGAAPVRSASSCAPTRGGRFRSARRSSPAASTSTSCR